MCGNPRKIFGNGKNSKSFKELKMEESIDGYNE
jgi:hypothetical protein